MPINNIGIALIKCHESLRLKAYYDPVGVLTVGFGHTSAAGQPQVTPGMTITKAEAETILRRDLAKSERAVLDAVSVPLNDNQFAALVSFCFNVGATNFRKSSVLRCVNDRQFDRVPSRLALWNKGGGRVLPGLVRRRKEEGELFMTPVARPAVEPVTAPPTGPKHGKTLIKSRTMQGAVASEAAGSALVVDSTTELASAAQQAEQSISAGTVFSLVIGLIIMFGAGFAIYARWDDGGRPLPGFIERRLRKDAE
jgi:lysozyme